jgi:hypothetical protein
MSKSIKKFLNSNLNNLLTPISHKKNNTSSSPYNVNDKNIFKNNLERINKNTKKELSSKKNKDKQKSNEVLLNNYFSQRSRTNTEGNDVNIKKLKFTSNFLRNKIESIFNTKNSRNNSKKLNFKNKNVENNNNFRIAKKVNNTKNIQNINKKTNNNAHFTKLITNSNKKIIDGNSYNNDFNITNIHNRSNTQTNFHPNKKLSNSTQKLKSYSSKYRNKNNYENMKKGNLNKIITNISGAIRQISPLFTSNNKRNKTQNYLKYISNKNKNISNNNKVKQNDKENKIIITEPKELKNRNKNKNNGIILKENSSYLVISKKPTQITNFIEKKENNKYINNYFNICENNKEQIDNEKNKQYISFEEVHFFFVKQIQIGKKLNAYINSHQS